ncbi:MAG: AcrR family transcriptional regulator [Cognaticolwellia sp.]|jgi:AcrR family transcriptional regulator
MAALAKAAQVSVPTLKHYFQDHDGVVLAALAAAHSGAQVYLDRIANPMGMPLAESVHVVGQDLLGGWPHGLGDLFGAALTHGLGSPAQGPAVVNHVLEPTIQGLETRLAVHQAAGELREGTDLRTASLCYLSPLLMGLLHQHQLAGAGCRPLDAYAFLDAHTDGWVRAWGA